MRPISLILAAVVAALAWGGSALAAIPEDGYLVFKESRLASVTEVRAVGTGQVLQTGSSKHGREVGGDECDDPSYQLAGPKWKKDPEFDININSTPGHINKAKTLVDLLVSNEAWDSPYETHCRRVKGKSNYEADFDGLTNRKASLATDLGSDGKNVVSFQSLEDSICDGATACVVLSFRNRKIVEADMALERDLTRYGFQDFWTTDNRTWWNDLGGRWAVVDVATHEFGHFAGLDHVLESPELTMFPFVHDGAQTLGLGDILGLNALY